MKRAVFTGLLASVLLGSSLQADSFRCGSKVVRTGDSPHELRQRCGEPQGEDSGYEEFWLDGKLQKVWVKRWHYKRGSRQLARVVLIYRGEIVAIQTGER